jgi:hypothetical protein
MDPCIYISSPAKFTVLVMYKYYWRICDMFRYKRIIFRDSNGSYENQWPKITGYLQGSSVCSNFVTVLNRQQQRSYYRLKNLVNNSLELAIIF